MRYTKGAVVSIGLSFIGWIVCLNTNAQWGWSDWWPPHRIQESVRTDTFKGQIVAVTNSTMTVKGKEVLIHRVRWSYGYKATEKTPAPSTSSSASRDPEQILDEIQTFNLRPSCRIFTVDGDRMLSGKLQVGVLVKVSYSVQTKGNRVADEITVSNLKQ